MKIKEVPVDKAPRKGSREHAELHERVRIGIAKGVAVSAEFDEPKEAHNAQSAIGHWLRRGAGKDVKAYATRKGATLWIIPEEGS